MLKLLHRHGPLKSVLQDELVSLIKLLVLILLALKDSSALLSSMLLLFIINKVQFPVYVQHSHKFVFITASSMNIYFHLPECLHVNVVLPMFRQHNHTLVTVSHTREGVLVVTSFLVINYMLNPLWEYHLLVYLRIFPSRIRQSIQANQSESDKSLTHFHKELNLFNSIVHTIFWGDTFVLFVD